MEPLLRAVRLAPALLVFLVPCGCGGGGGGDEGPPTTELIAFSMPAEDGFVRDTDDYWLTGSGMSLTGDRGAVEPGADYRQIFCFSLAVIPPDAVIVRATFRAYQHSVQGNPYGKLGDLVVERVEFPVGTASYADHSRGFAGTLSTSPAEGPRTLDVTAAVRDALDSGWPRFQLRLRFYSTVAGFPDDVTDYVSFVDGEISVGPAEGVPSVSIDFYVP